ncbi:DUF5640 domain-containing protein [Parabacteroides sp. OttesenSCG-928-G07]|nr:DUF5640 domain-containing protein [Parabacteroides sp. OttesenSCG-928-G07]
MKTVIKIAFILVVILSGTSCSKGEDNINESIIGKWSRADTENVYWTFLEDGTGYENWGGHDYPILWKVSGKKQITVTHGLPSHAEDFVYKVALLTSKNLILEELAEYSDEVVATLHFVKRK